MYGMCKAILHSPGGEDATSPFVSAVLNHHGLNSYVRHVTYMHDY